MTNKKKFFLIIHLTFALTYLFWVLAKPLLEETIVRKQMKIIALSLTEDKQYFPLLPEEKQKEIKSSLTSTPKIQIFSPVSPFAIAWIIFSLVIFLLLLFEINGAKQVVFLLPLLILGMIFFPSETKNSSVFPSEKDVLSFVETKSDHLKDRKQELEKGWHLYLTKNWGGQEENFEKGVFQFSVFRLEHFLKTGESQSITPFFAPPSFFSCILYFIWNTFFAGFMYKQEKCII